MTNPTREDFTELAKDQRYVPLYTHIMGDSLTPVLVYQSIRALSRHSYLLESVQQDEKLGRYSFIGFDPAVVFKSKGDQLELQIEKEENKTFKGDPFKELFKIMKDFRPAKVNESEFYRGGMVGYFGYDNIRHIEKIPDANPDDLQIPDSFFILPKKVVIFDHLYQSITIFALSDTSGSNNYDRDVDEIKNLLKVLSTPPDSETVILPNEEELSEPEFESNMTREDYMKIVERAKEYIVEGDIFQVVLSQRFRMDYQGDPFEVYRSLRRVNPSPYLFYLDFESFQIAGSSPEILVKREEDTLTLRPIAGTRRRGKDAPEDQELADELLADPKETAEHMMLVDLGRNDLGRVCQFGSVKPTRFKFIEHYSHVMHIVTNLEGKMAEGMDNGKILHSSFPAGTLSGAPKVRAMEIIDELEVSKRGFYGGAVVNLDFNGNFDSCIGIRTVLLKEGSAYIQAGAGIVADSVPATEYEECINKAKALMKAIQFTGKR